MRRAAAGSRLPCVLNRSGTWRSGLPFLRDGSRAGNSLFLLRLHRVWKRQVEPLRLHAILRVLVAEHIGGPVLRQDPARKPRHDHRRSDKRSIRKFCMVSNGSHAANSCFAVMKHPVVQNRFCGHGRWGVGGSAIVNSDPRFTASTNSCNFAFATRAENPQGLPATFFSPIEAPSCTLRPIRYRSPAV